MSEWIRIEVGPEASEGAKRVAEFLASLAERALGAEAVTLQVDTLHTEDTRRIPYGVEYRISITDGAAPVRPEFFGGVTVPGNKPSASFPEAP